MARYMRSISPKWVFSLGVAVALSSGLASYGQDNPAPNTPSSGGWRRFGDSNRGSTNPNPADANVEQEPGGPGSQRGPGYAPAPIPPTLTLPVGSWITVRVDQPLSSDHNQAGDSFSATLVQPLVADGRVIAHPGQRVQGRVVETQKAGRAKGTSRLGIELTELALVNGVQVPLKTQLVERRGDTSVGRDVGAVGVTAGAGAAIGAAAAGGFGAGLGALAGAGAATIGVLTTRGKATVVYPETQLTFRLEQPITISTERSEQAFETVRGQDYERAPSLRQRPMGRPGPGYYPGYYPPPAYYGAYPYFGSSLYWSSGPRFYYGRGYRGRW